jgi:hypothetical protein
VRLLRASTRERALRGLSSLQFTAGLMPERICHRCASFKPADETRDARGRTRVSRSHGVAKVVAGILACIREDEWLEILGTESCRAVFRDLLPSHERTLSVALFAAVRRLSSGDALYTIRGSSSSPQ